MEVAQVEAGFGGAAQDSDAAGGGSSSGRQRLVFEVPARGMIGFKSLFANITRGEGLLQRSFARCVCVGHTRAGRAGDARARGSSAHAISWRAGACWCGPVTPAAPTHPTCPYRYGPHRGPLSGSRKGVLVSMSDGRATLYALADLQQRGTFFIAPGEEVYGGMIVGEHSKEADMDINPSKEKQLTNVRSVQADDKLFLPPPRQLTLEEAIG